MSEAELERRHIRRLPTTMAGAFHKLEQDQCLMEAMGDLIRRSYLPVRCSEEKAFAEQDTDFEIRNHFFEVLVLKEVPNDYYRFVQHSNCR